MFHRRASFLFAGFILVAKRLIECQSLLNWSSMPDVYQYELIHIEFHRWMVITHVSYSWSTEFSSWPRGRPLWQVLYRRPQSLQTDASAYLKTGHGHIHFHFLPIITLIHPTYGTEKVLLNEWRNKLDCSVLSS